jgi:hypothetical protein
MRLKVYGWQSMRYECKGPHRQTREIVAAKSKAEVARIVGVKSPQALFNLGETHNALELSVALANPGVVFWAPINDRAAYYKEQKR